MKKKSGVKVEHVRVKTAKSLSLSLPFKSWICWNLQIFPEKKLGFEYMFLWQQGEMPLVLWDVSVANKRSFAHRNVKCFRTLHYANKVSGQIWPKNKFPHLPYPYVTTALYSSLILLYRSLFLRRRSFSDMGTHR